MSYLDPFFKAVEKVLTEKAKEKGYHEGDIEEYKNELMEFMSKQFGYDHALGEIVYKAIRFKSKRDPEDLVKIASWAALIWVDYQKNLKTTQVPFMPTDIMKREFFEKTRNSLKHMFVPNVLANNSLCATCFREEHDWTIHLVPGPTK